MKDLYLTLPPFAPDYGGACEMMYELGGLVLICDASGCTVNYVSFDEPRWHTRPGNVFCSGLTEIEAVMGDDEAVIQKALKAAEILKPNFIAYVGSSVPMIVGTDFEGIARETEERSGIPAFGFSCLFPTSERRPRRQDRPLRRAFRFPALPVPSALPLRRTKGLLFLAAMAFSRQA